MILSFPMPVIRYLIEAELSDRQSPYVSLTVDNTLQKNVIKALKARTKVKNAEYYFMEAVVQLDNSSLNEGHLYDPRVF